MQNICIPCSVANSQFVVKCCLVFCLKAGSLCLVNSRRESDLLNTKKARAHLYGGAQDSFQNENKYIVGIETGISRTEVRVLTTELLLTIINHILTTMNTK